METSGTGLLSDEKLIIATFDFLAEGSPRPPVKARQAATSAQELYDRAQRFDIWVQDLETEFVLPSPYGPSSDKHPLCDQYDELIECMLVGSGEDTVRRVAMQILFKKWSLDNRDEALLTFESELAVYGDLLGPHRSFIEPRAREHFGIGNVRPDHVANLLVPLKFATQPLPASDEFNALAPILGARIGIAGLDSCIELPVPPFAARTALLLCLGQIDMAFRKARARILGALRIAEITGYDRLSELARTTDKICTRECHRMFDVADATPPEALFHSRDIAPANLNGNVSAKLTAALEKMKPFAIEVARAKEELARARQALMDASATGVETSLPDNFDEEVKNIDKAKNEQNVAQTRFAVQRGAEAVAWPVLARISPEDVIAVLDGKTKIPLDDILFRSLRRCYDAAKTLKKTAGEKRKALVDEDRHGDNMTIPVEEVFWSGRPDPGETCWKYPKVMAGVGNVNNWVEDDLEYLYLQISLSRAARSIRESHSSAYARFGGCAELVLIVSATHACPPAGFMLDIILGARDVYQALKQYEATSMEYWCALEPGQSLAEDPPEVFPVLLAYLGVALSAYDVIKVVR